MARGINDTGANNSSKTASGVVDGLKFESALDSAVGCTERGLRVRVSEWLIKLRKRELKELEGKRKIADAPFTAIDVR